MIPPWCKDLFLKESAFTRAAVRYMARPGPIAMLIVVRNEADIIGHNIEFHRSFGIHNFVITDNGSTDGTREILANFQSRLGDSLVIIDDAEPIHKQSERVNHMIRVAKRTFRPRWIISSDADEFWYPVSGHYDSEIDGQKNILKCYWHNFLPRPNAPWQNFTDIGRMPGYHGGMNKLLCSARGLRGMYLGNHDSRSIPHIEARSENIRVYHYPVRSYEQFERKVVHGYRATMKSSDGASNSSASWHWRDYYKSWEGGHLARVYDDLASCNGVSSDRTMSELFCAGFGELPRSCSPSQALPATSELP